MAYWTSSAIDLDKDIFFWVYYNFESKFRSSGEQSKVVDDHKWSRAGWKLCKQLKVVPYRGLTKL